MIKFYAYYNHGGYKDFYLGSQTENVDFKYFLPLLNVHEHALKDNYDEELHKNVERQKSLPKLVALSDQTISYNYPSGARVMMSHSGYKLLYRQIKQQYILAIRDISGKTDSYGRQSPFNVMIIGDSEEDIKHLDSISEYIRSNIFTFEEQVSSFFENDFVENGLRFNFKAFNTLLYEIVSKNLSLPIDNKLNLPIRLLIIPSSTKIDKALNEQSIMLNDILQCYNVEGVLLHQAQIHHSENFDNDSNSFHRHSKDNDTPSIHEMFNVPKREEIKKLWDYIYKLEKRIVELENKD